MPILQIRDFDYTLLKETKNEEKFLLCEINSPRKRMRIEVVALGSSHSVALTDSGAVVSWGKGEDGQLGHGDNKDHVQPIEIRALRGKGVTSLACGAEYSVAICQQRREVYSWGWGDFGRLGHGDTRDVWVPRPIKALSGLPVLQVACGDQHSLVRTDGGEVYAFGRNQFGALGLGHDQDALVPRLVETLRTTKIVGLACGSEHSVAVTDQGQVYAWGFGRMGCLGTGDFNDRLVPTKCVGLDDVHVNTICCGWRHTIFVSDKGHVYTAGWSKFGQLGHGDFMDKPVPTLIESMKDRRVAMVCGGWRHSGAVTEDGTMYTWGWNRFGQLGRDPLTQHTPACQLGDQQPGNAGMLGVAHEGECNPHPGAVDLHGEKVHVLASGWKHLVVVTEGGTVYAWGRGLNGQLGHGVKEDAGMPVKVPLLSSDGLALEHLQPKDVARGVPDFQDRYAVIPDQVPAVPGTVPDTAEDQGVPSFEPKAKKVKH